MSKFFVFCLSTVGALTVLTMAAGAGAAGLYYWHGEGGCDSLPHKVSVHTENADGTQVFDLTPSQAATKTRTCKRKAECELPAADAVLPVPAASVATAGPSNAEIAELRQRLAEALTRLAALEAERIQDDEPTTPSESTPTRVDDF